MSSQPAKLKKMNTMAATAKEATDRGFLAKGKSRAAHDVAKAALLARNDKKTKKRKIDVVEEADESADVVEETPVSEEEVVADEADKTQLMEEVEDEDAEAEESPEEEDQSGEGEVEVEAEEEEDEEEEEEAPAPAKKAKLTKAGTMAATLKEAKERGFAASANAGDRATKTAAKEALVTPRKAKKVAVTKKATPSAPPAKKAKLAKAGTMAATLKEAKERGFAAEDSDEERPAAKAAKASLVTPKREKKGSKKAAKKVKLGRKGTMAATLEAAKAFGVTADMPLGSRRGDDSE